MKAAGKFYIVHKSRSDKIRIVFLADMHIGNAGCEKNRLRRDIEEIKNDPLAFVIGVGDYADYISPTDKRFDPQAIDPKLTIKDMGSLGSVLTKQVRDLLEPIKHKIIGLGFGNHEDKYMCVKEQQNLHERLCEDLGVADLGYTAILDLVFVRKPGGTVGLSRKAPDTKDATRVSKRVATFHGCSGATTPGGKLNSLARFIERFDADWYAMGHVHDRMAHPKIMIGADANCLRLKESKRFAVITGSYLLTYAQDVTTYGEKKGYAPVPLGYSSITYIPERDEAHAVI